MSDKHEGITTAYPVESIKAQSQGKDVDQKTLEQTPGHDHQMDPPAVWIYMEEWKEDGTPYLRNYVGTNKLQGKAAIITGGDSGIGRSKAVIVYLLEEDKDAKDTKKWIETKGRKCELVAVDPREEENCKKVVKDHMARFRRLDILVNNAVRQSMCFDFAEIDLKDVESTFRLNILAMFAITKYALPHMKRGSRIINSTSVTAYMTNPTLVDYSSTKGAIIAFTKSLGLQLAMKGIRVNGIAPGIIYTPLQPASNPSGNMEAIGKSEAPMGRPGMPVEVGVWYVSLASAEGSYMTGQIIHPNGGIEVQP